MNFEVYGNTIETQMQDLKTAVEYATREQEAWAKNTDKLTREYDKLRFLSDIKKGKIVALHADTCTPVKILWG